MKYIYLLMPLLLSADSIEQLAVNLNLQAGTKASVQWKRIFSSERRQVQYNINGLNEEQKLRLEKYLINHAADSDQPIVPGL